MGIKGLDEICIYALVDPMQGIVRYIGQTAMPEQRYKQHLSRKGELGESERAKWIKTLRLSGRRPFMVLLDCVPKSEGPRAESRWIAHFLSIGVKLYNERIK